jgi:hypothetical protein
MNYRFERDPEGEIILVNVLSIDMINNIIEVHFKE